MRERTTDKIFPFSYEGWDEACGDYGDIQFYGVEFTEDFGPIKKGSQFDCVAIYHTKAQLVAYVYNPQIMETVVNFKAIPA